MHHTKSVSNCRCEQLLLLIPSMAAGDALCALNRSFKCKYSILAFLVGASGVQTSFGVMSACMPFPGAVNPTTATATLL